MSFKLGDIVIVERVDAKEALYVRELEAYVGKEGKVIRNNFDDDDVHLEFPDDKWYFKSSWLKLKTEEPAARENKLLARVNTKEVVTKIYRVDDDSFMQFKTKREMMEFLFNEIRQPFTRAGVTVESLDEYIQQLQDLKEVCQKIN